MHVDERNDWKPEIVQCIWRECRHNKFREERSQSYIWGLWEYGGGGPTMAHIHILVQPTRFWWPHSLGDISGTPLGVRIQLCYSDCWKKLQIWYPLQNEVDQPKQLHKQQLGVYLFGRCGCSVSFFVWWCVTYDSLSNIYQFIYLLIPKISHSITSLYSSLRFQTSSL